jgi:hypothetical protein
MSLVEFVRLVLVKKWRCSRWLFLNEHDEAIDEFNKTMESFEYDSPRSAELLKHAEEHCKETADGLKEANERVDKLIGLMLIAIGWVAAKGTASKTQYWVLGVLTIGVSILLFGRWHIYSYRPMSIVDFREIAGHWGDDEQGFRCNIAKQYNRAAWKNDRAAQSVQKRLLLGVVFLVVGLVLFAFSF